MKYVYIYILCLILYKSNSQIRFNTNLPIGTDTIVDMGNKVIELNNQQFLSCGISIGYMINYTGSYLVKTTSNGDLIWKKQYDFSIGNYDSFTDLLQLPDSNYLLIGTTTNTTTGDYDVFLTKIDTSGSIIWYKQYVHADYDQGTELKLTPDGKVIIVGTAESVGVYNDVLLIKTDLNGNLIWRKRFGNTYDEVYNSIGIIKNNTEYLLGGKYGYSTSGTDYYDMSVMRTDTAGNIIWQQQYGTPGGNEISGCVLHTLDSGFVMCGTYNGSGALVKLDKNGNQKWLKNYSFPTDSYIRYIKQLSDSSFVFIINYTYVSTNSFTGFLNKTDKNGNLVWQRVYPGPTTIPNYFFGFNTTADKGFIMTGQYNHIGQPYQNMWLVKTDSLGCDSVTCSYLLTGVKETLLANTVDFEIYPNPTNGLLNISFNTIPQNTKIELYNSIGALVLTETMTNKNNIINLSELSNGIYFMKVVENNKVVAVKKVVRE